MIEPRPLDPASTPEVHLPRAPLAHVIAQVQFPPILAIRDPDKVAVLQETLRETYPNLYQEPVHSIELVGGQPPNVRQGLIWRLTDGEGTARWRVSLGVDFVALDTPSYDSRNDFLDRLRAVIAAVEQTFRPATTNRLGLRYIDRLTDEAVERIDELIHPEVLGMIRSPGNSRSGPGESVIHLMTEALFLARNGAHVQGRWGQLPGNATYDPDVLEPISKPSWVLDLDMFTTETRPFTNKELLTSTTDFAECLYWLFRQMITEEFLRFHGGEP